MPLFTFIYFFLISCCFSSYLFHFCLKHEQCNVPAFFV